MARRTSPKDRQKEARERLAEAVDALRSSEGWQRWLKVRASFHRYSFHNTLLIAAQRPDATRVAGYRQWQKLGRQVKYKEEGIRIFGFSERKPKKHEIEAGADPDKKIAWFPIVSVFDVSQTEPTGPDLEPIEPPHSPITGDNYIDRIGPLVAHADDIGVKVEFRSECPVEGYYQDSAKLIVVDESLCCNAQVRVLVHELAHAHGVSYEGFGRYDAEVMADAIAWIVCDAIGLDVSGDSVPYIAGWTSASSDALQEQGHTIDQIARTLILATSGSADSDQASAPDPQPIVA